MSETTTPDRQTAAHQLFIRLFLESERELLRYVMAVIPNAADARDVLQEAALSIWEKFDQYDQGQPFVPWACRFALNKARVFLRTQARRARLTDEVVGLLLAQRIEASERLDVRKAHLPDCLNRLPSHLQEVLYAHYFDGQTVPELSQHLHLGVEAVYKHLQRARGNLQTCIERKLASGSGL